MLLIRFKYPHCSCNPASCWNRLLYIVDTPELYITLIIISCLNANGPMIHLIYIPCLYTFVYSYTLSRTDYCTFFPLVVNFKGTGALHNHNATNAIQPATVTAIPAIHGHAPLIAQLRGHSLCAKWRTVTVFFSSMFDKNGLLYSTMKLKIPC